MPKTSAPGIVILVTRNVKPMPRNYGFFRGISLTQRRRQPETQYSKPQAHTRNTIVLPYITNAERMIFSGNSNRVAVYTRHTMAVRGAA